MMMMVIMMMIFILSRHSFDMYMSNECLDDAEYKL